MTSVEFKKNAPFALAISLLGVVGLIVLDYLLDAAMWQWLEPTADMNRFPYCETKRVGEFLRQPANVYSNSIYLFYGVLLLLLGKQEQKTSNLQVPVTPSILVLLLGTAYVYLFFGSSFFHASFVDLGHRLDINATLAVFIFLIAIGLDQLTPTDRSKTYALLGLIAVPICYALHYYAFGGIVLFVSLAVVLFLVAIANYLKLRSQYDISLLVTSVAMLGIGYSLHVCDMEHIGCSPDSWFQLHSIWHFLTGTGGFLGFLFFKGRKSC